MRDQVWRRAGVPGRRRRVVVLALAGVLLGGLLAVALPRFIGGGLEREPERAAAVPPARLVMPELRGLTVAAARIRLQALGVQRPPTVYRQFDGSVAAGRLTSTDPPARTPITPDTRISLIVSQGRGPDPVRSDQQRDNDAKSKDKRAEEKDKKEGKKGDGGKEVGARWA